MIKYMYKLKLIVYSQKNRLVNENINQTNKVIYILFLTELVLSSFYNFDYAKKKLHNDKTIKIKNITNSKEVEKLILKNFDVTGVKKISYSNMRNF